MVEESRTHGDILQEDFVDSYMNLTIKSVMGLKWASTHCPQARFLMKTDDDMFINVPSLLTYLQEASASTWITGGNVGIVQHLDIGSLYINVTEISCLFIILSPIGICVCMMHVCSMFNCMYVNIFVLSVCMH